MLSGFVVEGWKSDFCDSWRVCKLNFFLIFKCSSIFYCSDENPPTLFFFSLCDSAPNTLLFGKTIHPSAMEAKFIRLLKLVGVGFKARSESQGRELFLKLGYSHEVQFTAPPAVRVFCFKPNKICCIGIDKDRVHQFAGAVRSCKPPEVYKGKGVLYIDEVIKLKPIKKERKKWQRGKVLELYTWLWPLENWFFCAFVAMRVWCDFLRSIVPDLPQ